MRELPERGWLRFGAYEIELIACELRRGGAAVALATQPVRLLAMLAWRAEEVVTRDEIQRHLWPDGTVVEFDQGINHCVRQIRAALGDAAGAPRWVQTLPGRGYRFLAPATYAPPPAARAGADAVGAGAREVAAASGGGEAAAAGGEAASGGGGDPGASSPAAAAAAPRGPVPQRVRAAGARWGSVIAGAIAVATAVSAAGIAARRRPPAEAAARGAAPAAPRLVVVPLRPAAPDLAAVARGFAEELIAELGERYAPRLEVIGPRTALRYASSAQPLEAIGAELGASHVVEGSIAADRVTVQLVRTADHVQIWARTFGRGAGASAVAADVATALAVVLVPGAPPEPLPYVAEEDYLRGRYAMRRGHGDAAVAALERAAQRAPGSARVRAALAHARWRRGREPRAALRDAEAALAIAPALPEAHYVRALAALYVEWDAPRARRHFEAAIAANPAYAEAHHDLAACFSIEGRHAEAIASVQRARALDPLAPEVVSDVGWYYYFARRFAEAAAWCERTLAFEPGFHWAHRCRVLALARAGDLRGAVVAAAAHARALAPGAGGAGAAAPPPSAAPGGPGHPAEARGDLDAAVAARAPPIAALEAAVGVHSSAAPGALAAALARYWRWDLARALVRGADSDASDRAVTRLELGDREGALAELERAVAQRRGWLLPFLAIDPTFDPLRAEAGLAPRLAAVVAAARPPRAGGRSPPAW
jgi:DNA-binding winged helix-turn-helix (wHTH) protein/TolB-like protein